MISVGTPTSVAANPCHEFPWDYVPTVEEPAKFTDAKQAMSTGLREESKTAFQEFLRVFPRHELGEAARFALASLMGGGSEKEDQFLETIGNLQAARQRYPDSVFNPWALCMVGNLYREGGWFYESKGTFEQFLTQYPDHPLTPGVLISAGLNFLDNQQSLEAALVFRRVLDEPKWHPFHLEAALGLADGAAASKAWEQASYWYEAVALDAPEILRASSGSLYLRGVTEWELGNREEGINQFLTAFNLYPNNKDGGRALVQLARSLAANGPEVPALWFANQAIKRFPQQEPEYVGRSILLEWAMNDLRKGPDAVFNSEVRSRLSELGIAVPVTWNEFRGESARLAMVSRPEISGMARFWIAESYEIEGRHLESLPRLVEVLVNYSDTEWGPRAAEIVKQILVEYYAAQDWVSLLSFFDTYPGIFALLNPDARLKLMIAKGYLALQLPQQSLVWLDRVLEQSTPPLIEEEALGKKVRLAHQLGLTETVKEAGLAYERSYPDGPQITKVASSLGTLALAEKEYPAALDHYAKVLSHVTLREEKRSVQRKILGIFRAAGEIDKSIDGYRHLIHDYGEDAEDLAILGDLLFEQKRYQEAVVPYTRVVELQPSSTIQLWAKYRLAVSYRYAGNIPEARRLLKVLKNESGANSRLEQAIKAAAAAQESGFLLVAMNGVDRATQK